MGHDKDSSSHRSSKSRSREEDYDDRKRRKSSHRDSERSSRDKSSRSSRDEKDKERDKRKRDDNASENPTDDLSRKKEKVESESSSNPSNSNTENTDAVSISTPAPSATEIAASASKEEEMRKRREAWKRLMEQQQLDKELNKSSTESNVADNVTSLENNQNGTSTSSNNETAPTAMDTETSKANDNQPSSEGNDSTLAPNESKSLVNGTSSSSDVNPSSVDSTKDGPTSSITAPAAPEPDDEIDPLDAFMNEINQQVKKDTAKPTRANVPTPANKTNGSNKTKKGGKMGERYYSDEDLSNASDLDSDKENQEEEESALLQKLRKKTLAQVDHATINYLPFKKNFYIEVPEIARMTPEEIEKYRDELESIKIRGKDCPAPIRNFTQAGLSNRILKVLEKNGYNKPTPIQCQSIPAIMSGRDVIGCAKTGSGKTLSFLLPMFRHIMDQPPLKMGEGCIGMIMAPTRELAMQIHAEVKKFTKALSLRCVCVYGGSGVASQIADLKRGAEIVVCTPGRMIDVLCTNAGKVTNLTRCTFLVLDEADRMFDMGFEPQIMRIINNIRPDRQTVLFSATFPRQVEMLARKILTKPLEIVVGGRSIVCSDVTQVVEVRNEETKFKRLLELLKEWSEKGACLIFVDRQEACDRLFTDLMKAGYPCLSLHGGMDQQDRDFTIDDFKRKVKTIMVATSVAARGLDVKDLNLVVNYDVPNHMEDYVHRVGRTGRAGSKGTAYTFITPEEDKFAGDIVKALEVSGATIPDDLKALADAFGEKKKAGLAAAHGSGYGGKGYKFDEAEQMKKDEERRRQRKVYGAEEDQEEEEQEFNDDEDSIPSAASAVIAATAALGNANQTATASAAANAVSASRTEVVPGVGAVKTPLSAKESAAQQAIAQIKGKLGPSAGGGQKDLRKVAELLSQGLKVQNTGEHFAEELEINDYPQQARWKVTHKDALSAITEWTAAAITTRGSYIPPGRNPSLGERKLYLYIEGPDQSSVKKAKAEIMRILEEATMNAAPEKAMYSKYKVV